MTIGIIVATHGKSAKEMLNSVEMILGSQEKIETIDFIVGDGIDDLLQKYAGAKKALATEELLILTDILGGSPFNAAYLFASENREARVVTGVNIPMLIEALSSRDYLPLDELIEAVMATAKNSIVYREYEEENEDEF